VVAAVMDEEVASGDDGRLRKPGVEIDIVGYGAIGLAEAPNIDDEARGKRGEDRDHALDEIRVGCAETAEAEIDEGTIAAREGGQAERAFPADAALQVDECFRVERTGAIMPYDPGRQQQIEPGRGFEKNARRQHGQADACAKTVETLMRRRDSFEIASFEKRPGRIACGKAG